MTKNEALRIAIQDVEYHMRHVLDTCPRDELGRKLIFHLFELSFETIGILRELMDEESVADEGF